METKIFQKQGRFLILALDQRGALRKMLNPQKPQAVSKEQMIEIKKEIISALPVGISGLLLDTDFGLSVYKKTAKKAKVPLLLAVEKSGFQEEEDGRHTEIEHKVSALKSLGADGVKLLLYFNPFNESAQSQLKIGKEILKEAQANKLPLFLEIITYTAGDKEMTKGDLIIESLQMFLDNGLLPDVFKLEYPESAEACQRITELLGQTPWVLLSGGEKFNNFKKQLEEAMANGAAGFLAGRALWQEVVDYQQEEQKQEREKFLKKTLPSRFKQLSQITLR